MSQFSWEVRIPELIVFQGTYGSNICRLAADTSGAFAT